MTKKAILIMIVLILLVGCKESITQSNDYDCGGIMEVLFEGELIYQYYLEEYGLLTALSLPVNGDFYTIFIRTDITKVDYFNMSSYPEFMFKFDNSTNTNITEIPGTPPIAIHWEGIEKCEDNMTRGKCVDHISLIPTRPKSRTKVI